MSAPEVLSSVGLLDCPCCGARPVFENLILEAVVRCPECRLSMVRQHAAKKDTGVSEALMAWNKRHDDILSREGK